MKGKGKDRKAEKGKWILRGEGDNREGAEKENGGSRRGIRERGKEIFISSHSWKTSVREERRK